MPSSTTAFRAPVVDRAEGAKPKRRQPTVENRLFSNHQRNQYPGPLVLSRLTPEPTCSLRTAVTITRRAMH